MANEYFLLLGLIALVNAAPLIIRNAEPVNNAFPSTVSSDLYGTNVPGVYVEKDCKTKEERRIILDYNDTLIDRLWCPQTFHSPRRGYFGKNTKHERVMCRENYGDKVFACELTTLIAECKSIYDDKTFWLTTSKIKRAPQQPVPSPMSISTDNSEVKKDGGAVEANLWKTITDQWLFLSLIFVCCNVAACLMIFAVMAVVHRFCSTTRKISEPQIVHCPNCKTMINYAHYCQFHAQSSATGTRLQAESGATNTPLLDELNKWN